MSPNEKNVICFCHFCSGWLRFQTIRAGEVVNCPQCLMETVLFVPNAPLPYRLDNYPVDINKMQWESSDLGYRCIVGEVSNESRSDLDWIRIEFVLYNGAGMPLGVASDCLFHFAMEALWRFRVPVFHSEAVRASLPVLVTEFGKIHSGAQPGHGVVPGEVHL